MLLPKIGSRIRVGSHTTGRRLADLIERYVHRMRPLESDMARLDETMAWLARAQDACDGKGVSTSYDQPGGWHPDPYPETSGYILPTFLKYADLCGNVEFANRAASIGRWEIDIQRSDGAVLSSIRRDVVRVFNTGQVILGWCCLFERTTEQRFLDAARQAGDYILSRQEPDGSWIRDTYPGAARTYYVRATWSLLRLAELTGKERFVEAGVRNVHWVLTQQNENGWFRNGGFDDGPPLTHAIGYTIQGLMECQQLSAKHSWPLDSDLVLDAVEQACESVVGCVNRAKVGGIPGLLPATFDDKWQPAADYSCLTGNAQLAICLMRLGQIRPRPSYFRAASHLIDALKRVQALHDGNPGIRGGVAGSFPFHAPYAGGRYLNWAAKFMADALMMRARRKDKLWPEA